MVLEKKRVKNDINLVHLFLRVFELSNSNFLRDSFGSR